MSIRNLTNNELQSLLDYKKEHTYKKQNGHYTCSPPHHLYILIKYINLKNTAHLSHKTRHFRKKRSFNVYNDCPLSISEIAHAVMYGIDNDLIDVIKRNSQIITWKLKK